MAKFHSDLGKTVDILVIAKFQASCTLGETVSIKSIFEIPYHLNLNIPALEQSTVFLPPDHLQVHLGSPGHVSAALADDTSKNNSILIKKTNMVRLLVQTPKALKKKYRSLNNCP